MRPRACGGQERWDLKIVDDPSRMFAVEVFDGAGAVRRFDD
jgi:hypothetical protein